MTALSLKEAAEFLHVHPETLRRLAVAGFVRGSKLARWKFLKDDLEAAVRSGYPYSALRGKEDECSAKSKAAVISILSSPSVEKEYENLLAPKTGSSRKNTNSTSGKNSGKLTD